MARARAAWANAALEEMRRIVHRMVGSGGTFGFPRVSAAAAPLEVLLDALIATGDTGATADIRAQVEALTANLAAICQEASSALDGGDGMANVPAGDEADGTILVLADSDELAQSIRKPVEAVALTIETVAEPAVLLRRVAASRPVAVIADGVPASDDVARRDVLRMVAGRSDRPCPLIFASRDGDASTRLAAVAAGGAAFLLAPIDPNDLLDEIERLTLSRDEVPFRVLVIDDEAPLAECYALILEQEGMTVRFVTEALRSLDLLAEFDPDLVLVDLYMPECDGLALAQVIRQQRRYHHIPLVFLSTEANLDRQLKARRLGGDDFLTKPILPSQLVSAVTSRIERHRTLRTLMERDALTGLLNHTAIISRLDAELIRARHGGGKLAVAMLDIDFFKRVNDSQGHPTGDLVLVALAKHLKRGVRRSDAVGRYGGEEFAVVLPDCDADTAVATIDRLRTAFGELRHGGPAGAFTATFSAGVAGDDPGDASATELLKAADEALYAAKAAGRNRVCRSSSIRSSGPGA